MKLISFDIFDTVLIRKCGLPENIFPIRSRETVSQRLGIPTGVCTESHLQNGGFIKNKSQLHTLRYLQY